MPARTRTARQEDEGFTLIELLVVIIIIGILAAIAIPTFLNQRNKGYDAQAKSDLKHLATLEETVFGDTGVYVVGDGLGTPLRVTGLPEYVGSPNVTAVKLVGYLADGTTKTTTAASASGGVCMQATSTSGRVWVYDSTRGGLLGEKTTGNACA